jgi:hypothetical protein
MARRRNISEASGGPKLAFSGTLKSSGGAKKIIGEANFGEQRVGTHYVV